MNWRTHKGEVVRVYVAGPYTKGDVARNVANAMEVGNWLISAGWAPYVPHLSHFLHMQSQQPYATWISFDLVWLRLCHAVIRLIGESAGADGEVALARKLGIPVFVSDQGHWCYRQFLDWLDQRFPEAQA